MTRKAIIEKVVHVVLSGLLLTGLITLAVAPWPAWVKDHLGLLVGALVGFYAMGILTRAEERAQRRTDAYVGALDSVKGAATWLLSSAERLSPDEAARILTDIARKTRPGKQDVS
jgi:hypothetical protein